MKVATRVAVGLLSLTAAGLMSIANLEGFRNKAYIPVAGDVPTIGFGHTEGVKMGDTITMAEGLNLLHEDVRTAEDAVRKCVKVPLYPHEFDSYTSLAYNIGAKAFCDSTLVRKLNAGDYTGACEEIKRWTYAGGRELQGLKNRRAVEYAKCIGRE